MRRWFVFIKRGEIQCNVHRFIQIRIRLFVIFRQIVQFFQHRLPFTLKAVVETTQTNRIVFGVLFLTLGKIQGDLVTFILQGIKTGNVLKDVLELRIRCNTLVMCFSNAGPNGFISPDFV